MKPVLARALPLFGLALFVFSARAWLMRSWGSPLPFWDQWYAEALSLYLPWLRGEFAFSQLFLAHNEHRIALTRVADLALFLATGSWSIWLQLLLNAILHAGAAAVVAAALLPPLLPRGRAAIILGTALLFAGTTGWQNALWGFQSQFAFSLLFSLLASAFVLSDRPPLSRTWWLGWACASLSLFSQASGFLTVIVIAAGTVLHHRSAPPVRRSFVVIASIALIVAGLALQVDAPHHRPLRADSFAQFLSVFARGLAWPFINQGMAAIALQAPLLAWLIVSLRHRQPLTAADRCAFAFGALGMLHAAAIAYSRGAGLVETGPLSRYQDAFLPGTAAQLYALLRLAPLLPRPARLAPLGWIALFLFGWIALSETNLTLHLPHKRTLDRIGLEAIRTSVATSNHTALFDPIATLALHPSRPESVVDTLREPRLRAILPPDLLAPPDSPLRQRPWVIEHARSLTAAASALLLAALLLPLRREAPAQVSAHSTMRTSPG